MWLWVVAIPFGLALLALFLRLSNFLARNTRAIERIEGYLAAEIDPDPWASPAAPETAEDTSNE